LFGEEAQSSFAVPIFIVWSLTPSSSPLNYRCRDEHTPLWTDRLLYPFIFFFFIVFRSCLIALGGRFDPSLPLHLTRLCQAFTFPFFSFLRLSSPAPDSQTAA